jgi:FkbM family methyltransferase
MAETLAALGGGLFTCAPDMVEHLKPVLAGAYDVPLEFAPRVFLDIGANAGAASVWAKRRWPKVEIVAYEPALAAFGLLQRNLPGMIAGVRLYCAAVTPRFPGKPATLYHGLSNSGEASLTVTGGPSSEEVNSVHPTDLPWADFVKLDCEGEERAILESLRPPQWRRMMAMAVEIHRQEDYEPIVELAISYGLRQCFRKEAPLTGGVFKFIRPWSP